MCQIYRSTNTAATTATVNISIAVAEPLLTTSWQGVAEQITLLVPRRRQRPLLLTESLLVSFSGVRVGTLCVRAYVLQRVLVCVRARARVCVCVCVCPAYQFMIFSMTNQALPPQPPPPLRTTPTSVHCYTVPGQLYYR